MNKKLTLEISLNDEIEDNEDVIKELNGVIVTVCKAWN
jgi:hypothetical protein